MNGGEVVIPPATAVNPAVNQPLGTDIDSHRIALVADKLAMSALKDEPHKFFNLCIALARGIDYGVAHNDPPAQASKLAPVVKQVCSRKNVFYLQSAIMVLMISVKNACKLGWFGAKDTEELLALADEVGNYFHTGRNVDSDAGGITQALTSVMSRYYPQYKISHIIASLEVKPGYGAYVVDFQITKDLLRSKDERIRLLVAMRNDFETSSCIVNPQQANILLDGRPVDKRTNVNMDPGPQAPTIVNQLLSDGTNLLQAVGQFNDHYILVIAAMSTSQTSDLPAPQDYVQPDTTISDSDIIEGASRISLNCPISYKRINVPAKGYLCKHYQCFDLSNYVEINLKRPSWRCPHCNQSVCFTDLRVDRMMVKVLQDVGENVSEVTISADGSWTAASSNDDSHDKTTSRQDGHDGEDSSVKSDAPCNVYDLTEGDDEMDAVQIPELVDKKSVLHVLQGQTVNSYSTAASIPRGNFGIAPVVADAVPPSLNRQPNNLQGTVNRTNCSNRHLLGGLHDHSIARNVVRIPSANQALPVQMTGLSSQQHARPIINDNLPTATGSATRFQIPLASDQLAASGVASNLVRQRHLPQSHMNPQDMASASQQSRVAPQGGATSPSYNLRMPQTLSQPPHLMRLSQLALGREQGSAAGVRFINSPSTVQRVQLPPQQPSQTRLHRVPQTQSVKMPTSLPSNVVAPQGVSRTENLIDIQQAEQNWRPTGRMRGALTGQAYSAALSQFMGQSAPSPQTPSPRPSVSAASPAPHNLQILIANRRIAEATQSYRRAMNGATPEASASQAEGTRGFN